MGRSGSISNKQKELLTEFMTKHSDLQAGRFTNTFTFKIAQNLWVEITDILNSIPDGANKDWRQWRKTWQDLKKNVKAKVSKNRISANTTGGGEVNEVPLDTIENSILSLMPQEITAGLSRVDESMINFSYEPLHTEGNIDQVAEEVEIEEAGPSTAQNNEDHNYTMEDYCNNSKVKKLTKTRRLQNSLKLSQELLNTINKKLDVMSEYYNVKKEYYEHWKLYEEKKLQLMEGRYCCNCKH